VYTLDVNYSFSVSTQGRATPGRIDLDSAGNARYTWDTDVNKRVPIETNFSRPHIVRTNLFLQYPDNQGLSLLDRVLSGTSMSILYRFVSGQTFTYLGPTDPPDTYDNQRYPASHTVDLRIDKAFKLFGTSSFSLYARITNLLNTKNVKTIGDVFFDVNAVKRYVETGQVTTVDGGGYDISWQTWYEPRRIYLGARYVF
jgi:hypothetical protein